MNTAALAVAVAGCSSLNRSNGGIARRCTEVDQIFHTSSTEARRQGQINLHRDYEDGSMYDPAENKA